MEMTKRKNRSIYHWVILVCCILILMFSYSTRVGLAQLFATEILKETGFSSGAYFLSTTLTSVACAISGPITGKLLRGKYMRTTFVLCSIGTMGSYACYGLCHSLWQFYIVGTLVGVFAMGCGTLLVSVLITNWFEKNRGLMISIAMMGISIGGTVLSPLLSWLIVEFGWRNAYFILSALSLIVLVPIGLFVVRRTPQDAGLEPYGHGEESTASAKKKNVPASNWNATLKEARQTPILWMFALGAFLIYFTACIMQHQSYYLQGVGFDAASIASYISLYSVVAIIGKLVLGRIFDRFGPKIGILFGCGTFFVLRRCDVRIWNLYRYGRHPDHDHQRLWRQKLQRAVRLCFGLYHDRQCYRQFGYRIGVRPDRLLYSGADCTGHPDYFDNCHHVRLHQHGPEARSRNVHQRLIPFHIASNMTKSRPQSGRLFPFVFMWMNIKGGFVIIRPASSTEPRGRWNRASRYR